MADNFDTSPNFLNPAYATPEQIKALRAYSDQLMTGHGQQKVLRPEQGLSNVVNALVGGYFGNQANQQEKQSLQQALMNAQGIAQNPTNPPIGDVARTTMDPYQPTGSQNLARGLITPEKGADVYGRPITNTVVGGVQAQPVGPGVQPGFRGDVRVSPEGVSTPTPFPAPPAPNSMPFAQPSKPPSPPPNPLGAAVQNAIPAMNTLSANAAKNKGNAAIIEQDTQIANDAPNVIKFANTISDLINSNKGKLTWGPGSELSQEIKKGVVNFAPGMSGVLAGPVAAADAIQKTTASLSTALSRQLGGGVHSDAQLANSISSVPSLHNSEQGALAMADMITQSAKKSIEAKNFAIQDPENYQARKQQYLNDHPVINPLTGNPIMLDIGKEKFKASNGPGATPASDTGGGWGNVRELKK